jgi:ribosomal-protein-alanine N-acetyltransferase
VAHIGEKVIGYGGMWLMIDEAHITNVAVHPTYRKMGVGHSILKALTYEASKNGADKMTLEVRVSNRDALSLYTRMGFVAEGIRKRYYSDNDEDAFIMWKTMDKKA